MTIDAWVACADAVIAAGGEADDRAGAALAGLGLTDDERGQLTVAVKGTSTTTTSGRAVPVVRSRRG